MSPSALAHRGQRPRSTPEAGRRADRRQHPPVRAGTRVSPRSRSPTHIGRPVRFVGRPDIAPLGPLMQRLGGLLARADEIAGALRAGQLVVMGADHGAPAPGRSRRPPSRRGRRRDEGRVSGGDRQLAVGRSSRVEIGPAVRPDRRRRGPLTELEMADLSIGDPATARRVRRHPHRHPARLASVERHRGRADMTYATRDDGVRLHYKTTGRAADRRCCSSRASVPTSTAGRFSVWRCATLPHRRARQPRRRAQRQAARPVLTRADGRRRDRRARSTPASNPPTSSARRWVARSPRSSRSVSRARPLADADVHVVSQPPVAPRPDQRLGRDRAPERHGVDDQ